MADAVVQIPVDGAGKKLDAETLTVGANTVYRERIQIAGAAATDVAPVTAVDGLLVHLGTNNDVSTGLTTADFDTGAGTDTRAVVGLIRAESGGGVLIGSASPLPAAVTDTANLLVKPGDAVNNAIRVNVVAGSAAVADTELPAAVLLADNTASPTAPAVGAFLMGFDGTNWDRLQTGAATGGALKVDGSAVTQPVSGTVAVTGVATAAAQATQLTALQLIDDTVATLGTDLYTEATTKGLVVGAVRRDADTTLVGTTNEVSPLQVDANGRLKVEAFSGETLPVSGTVTVNAGTNLNTSTLALEAGGNLAGAATSLAVVDDWDESDRAKVNMIVGQAGVAGDVGVTGATVQRVVQANGAGKTILSAGGSAAASGNNTLLAAGTNRLKVFAFSLTTLSTTAMTCIFQSGASGTEIWRVVLQAATSTSTGANLSTALPAWLFATASATLLNLNLSSANAVHWSVSYYDEA